MSVAKAYFGLCKLILSCQTQSGLLIRITTTQHAILVQGADEVRLTVTLLFHIAFQYYIIFSGHFWNDQSPWIRAHCKYCRGKNGLYHEYTKPRKSISGWGSLSWHPMDQLSPNTMGVRWRPASNYIPTLAQASGRALVERGTVGWWAVFYRGRPSPGNYFT